MPPKFQSSFIPKGSTAPTSVMPQTSRATHRDFFSFVAKIIFGISILLALAAVGYKFYLNYSIERMGSELESMRQELSNGAVDELVDLNNRIVTTQSLLKRHRVFTPLFEYLQVSTPQTVRFTDFNYIVAEQGPQITIKGEARSYAALAYEADIINKNADFKNAVFSDLRLDDKGSVTFTLKMNVAPTFLSYEEEVSQMPIRAATSSVRTTIATSTALTATTTATSTAKTATSTRN